jgi:hypothetical protein
MKSMEGNTGERKEGDTDTCGINEMWKDCEGWRYELNHSLLNLNGFSLLLLTNFVVLFS